MSPLLGARASRPLYKATKMVALPGRTRVQTTLEAAIAIVLLGYSLALQACSVGMAASGHEKMDTSIAFPGSNRAVIVSKLGPPETSRQMEDGKIQDSYLIKQGNEKSSGRAWAFAGLDLLTLGLCEAVGTPYELAQSEETYRLLITYNPDGTVAGVQKMGGK